MINIPLNQSIVSVRYLTINVKSGGMLSFPQVVGCATSVEAAIGRGCHADVQRRHDVATSARL